MDTFGKRGMNARNPLGDSLESRGGFSKTALNATKGCVCAKGITSTPKRGRFWKNRPYFPVNPANPVEEMDGSQRI